MLNGYAERDEKIRIIAAIPDTPQCLVHLEQLKEEVAGLQQEKGFIWGILKKWLEFDIQQMYL